MQGGRTPLHLACFYGHPETAQLLLENGCIVDLEDDVSVLVPQVHGHRLPCVLASVVFSVILAVQFS